MHPEFAPSEAPIRLNDERLMAVVEALRATGAKTIADLGCGEGKLLHRLLRERWAERLIGLDPAARELEWAAKRLKLHLPGGPPEGRVSLLHGSLTYRDDRWADADAAALIEVIEHLDPDRLPLVERVVFGEARPATVVVTTPNAEYNALFPNLAAGAFRHPDHRFEWTRSEFQAWADTLLPAARLARATSQAARDTRLLLRPVARRAAWNCSNCPVPIVDEDRRPQPGAPRSGASAKRSTPRLRREDSSHP
jgi:3' terminal RNA ribose 2'-O-methyltransferase Hen1